MSVGIKTEAFSLCENAVIRIGVIPPPIACAILYEVARPVNLTFVGNKEAISDGITLVTAPKQSASTI